MLVVFLGPPGSGKGTQARIISAQMGLKHVSTGDMLREVSKSASPLGRKLSEYLEKGELVNDDLVNQIVAEFLAKPEYKNGFILDGFPRTLAQAKFLEEIYTGSYKVIHFKIDVEKLKHRVEGRFNCLDCGEIYNKYNTLIKEGECNKCHGSNFQYRADDNVDSLVTRITKFEEQIVQILEFYNERNRLSVVNADEAIENVTKQIVSAVKNG